MERNISFSKYLKVQTKWERELAPLVKRMIEDPNFPQISKSFELTRCVLDRITSDDLRWHSRKEILWGTRFIWGCYKAAVAAGMGATDEEIPVLWA